MKISQKFKVWVSPRTYPRSSACANTHITNQHQASHSAAAHELVAVVPPDGDLEPEDEALRT